MLMRFDPFRDVDELLRQWTNGHRRSVLAMDAYRRGDSFVVELDLPGVAADSIDVTVERNVLHVTAQRSARFGDGDEVLVAERPHGAVTRQLFLGEGLDSGRIQASYEDGVLTIVLPVAEEARPQKVAIRSGGGAQPVEASASS